MASLGINRLEIGLYTALLAQKRAQMGYFLEVTDPKRTNKERIIMNPKLCCCNEQCIAVNLNFKI